MEVKPTESRKIEVESINDNKSTISVATVKKTLVHMTANAIVSDVHEVAPGLKIIRVVPNGWELPHFEAGQFGVLGLPESAPRCAGWLAEDNSNNNENTESEKLIKRAYSIASSSKQDEYIEFYITLVTTGQLTPRLFELKIGDPIFMGKRISGLFTLQEVPTDQHVVLVSTGTGLAPYMSMLRSTFACGANRRFTVLHGARQSWDLGYRSELMSLQRLCKNFSYIPIISRPQNEATPWRGQVGYVQDLWQKEIVGDEWKKDLTPENTHVFLCGHPGMIEGLQVILESDGYKLHSKKVPGQIHVEKYW